MKMEQNIEDKLLIAKLQDKIKKYSLPNDYPDDIITLLKQSNILLNLNPYLLG